MRIAIDCRKYLDFGIGTYIQGLVRGLEKIDSDDEYILLAPGRAENKLPSEGRFRIVPENSSRYSLEEMFALRRHLDAIRPDVFHAPHYVIPPTSIPTVVTIHDLIHLRLRGPANVHKRMYARWMIGRAVRESRKIMTVTHAVADDVVRHFAAAANKLEIIPNGVDEAFTPGTEHAQGNYFLYVGNDKPHKNLDFLVKAFRLLRNTHPTLSLVIVGSAPDRYSEIPGIAMPGRVPQQDLVKLYRGAIALLMPSLEEGFGLPIAEAMSCGTPVICSQIPALVEVAGGAAILIDPYREEEIASWMVKISTDANLRRDLMDRGRARAKEWSWEKCARMTLEAYRAAGRN